MDYGKEYYGVHEKGIARTPTWKLERRYIVWFNIACANV